MKITAPDLLDDTAIYDRALTAAEVRALYNNLGNVTGIGYQSQLQAATPKETLAAHLGYDDWADLESAATAGNTIIDGGYLRTELIRVLTLFAEQGALGTLRQSLRWNDGEDGHTFAASTTENTVYDWLNSTLVLSNNESLSVTGSFGSYTLYSIWRADDFSGTDDYIFVFHSGGYLELQNGSSATIGSTLTITGVYNDAVMAGDFVPSADDQYQLGQALKRFKAVWSRLITTGDLTDSDTAYLLDSQVNAPSIVGSEVTTLELTPGSAYRGTGTPPIPPAYIIVPMLLPKSAGLDLGAASDQWENVYARNFVQDGTNIMNLGADLVVNHSSSNLPALNVGQTKFVRVAYAGSITVKTPTAAGSYDVTWQNGYFDQNHWSGGSSYSANTTLFAAPSGNALVIIKRTA